MRSKNVTHGPFDLRLRYCVKLLIKRLYRMFLSNFFWHVHAFLHGCVNSWHIAWLGVNNRYICNKCTRVWIWDFAIKPSPKRDCLLTLVWLFNWKFDNFSWQKSRQYPNWIWQNLIGCRAGYYGIVRILATRGFRTLLWLIEWQDTM
jgi:hypothetical protein